jgi:hypothetical protein
MNKKILHILVCLVIAFNTTAQTVSTFETLPVPSVGYWKGVNSLSLVSGFQDGNAYFVNSYDTSSGGYWGGWAYSKVVDTTTPGYANEFGCIAGMGYDSSMNYAVAYQDYNASNNMIRITGAGASKVVKGFYITNTTYAYLSMKNGDFVAKKFGGITGSDSDYFRIKIKAYSGATLKNDSVVFYLADFRDANNANDYIVKNWRWVDLQQFGNIDSLTYTLESSDVGMFGMNTPAYFAVDNFTTINAGVGVENEALKTSLLVYPNPIENNLSIVNNNSKSTNVIIYTIDGKQIATHQFEQKLDINTTSWSKGLYFVEIKQENAKAIYKIKK